MNPSYEDTLRVFGSRVRATRLLRELTQEKLAEAANISRAQLALLENGANVSLLFLLKVGRVLGLELSLQDRDAPAQGHERIDVIELLDVADALAVLVDHLRSFAVAAVLPASERTPLKDAPALRAFVERQMNNPEGLARVSDALQKLSRETPVTAPPRITEEPRKLRRKAPRRKHSV